MLLQRPPLPRTLKVLLDVWEREILREEENARGGGGRKDETKMMQIKVCLG